MLIKQTQSSQLDVSFERFETEEESGNSRVIKGLSIGTEVFTD